eukprot:gene31340-6491_t
MACPLLSRTRPKLACSCSSDTAQAEQQAKPTLSPRAAQAEQQAKPILTPWAAQAEQQAKPTLTPLAVASERVKPELAPLDGSYEDSATLATFGNWLVPGRLLAELPPQDSSWPLQDHGKHQGMLQYKEAAEQVYRSLDPPGGGGDQLSFLHCPITDLGVPASVEELLPLDSLDAGDPIYLHCKAGSGQDSLDARDIIYLHCKAGRGRDSLDAGDIIYLHCKAGRGRAGTVSACLLAYYFGLEEDPQLGDAIQHAHGLGLPGESPLQLKRILVFHIPQHVVVDIAWVGHYAASDGGYLTAKLLGSSRHVVVDIAWVGHYAASDGGYLTASRLF